MISKVGLMERCIWMQNKEKTLAGGAALITLFRRRNGPAVRVFVQFVFQTVFA